MATTPRERKFFLRADHRSEAGIAGCCGFKVPGSEFTLAHEWRWKGEGQSSIHAQSWFDRPRVDGYYSYMKKAGIAALKNNLSRYLDQVKSGETILVMDRNQPVAQIVPLPSAARGVVSDDDRLSRLERKGLIRHAPFPGTISGLQSIGR